MLYAGLAAFVALVWGLCFVLIQASLPNPNPLLLAGTRALIGGTVLGAVILLRETAAARRSGTGPAWPWRGMVRALPSPGTLTVLALTNAALPFGAMYLAAARAEAAVAAVLVGVQPVALALAGWLWFGERASLRGAAGLGLGLVGVVFVAFSGSSATTLDGVALALLAAAAPAGGTLLMRRLSGRVDLLTTTAAQFLLGGIVLVAASAAVEPWAGVPWAAALPGLLVLGVLGTGVGYVAWFWLLPRLSLLALGAALLVVPIAGVAFGIAAGDRPPPIEIGGMGLTLAGIGLVALDAVRRRPSLSPAADAAEGERDSSLPRANSLSLSSGATQR